MVSASKGRKRWSLVERLRPRSKRDQGPSTPSKELEQVTSAPSSGAHQATPAQTQSTDSTGTKLKSGLYKNALSPAGRVSYVQLALEQLEEDDPSAVERIIIGSKKRADFSGSKHPAASSVASENASGNSIDADSNLVASNLVFESLLNSVKGKRHRRSRKDNLYARCVTILLEYKDIIYTAAAFDHNGIAPTVVRGVVTLLQLPAVKEEFEEKMLRDIEEVSFMLRRWANTELQIPPRKLLDGSLNSQIDAFEDFEECLIQFHVAILQWLVNGLENADRTHLVRVLGVDAWKRKWDRLTDIVKSKDNVCDAAFKLAIEAIQIRSDVLTWLYPQDPINDHDEILNRTKVSSIYSNSGQWFIESEEFQRWSDQRVVETSPVLWVRGTVGTGKTTLITRIIQYHLQNSARLPSRRLAYFYCSRDRDTNTDQIIRAILRQTSADVLYTSIVPEVFNYYTSCKNTGSDRKPSYHICIKLLKEILASGLKVRIIIDALDECKDPDELLKALFDLSESSNGKHLELLLASRHEVDIAGWFPDCQSVDVNERMPIDEMERFISMEIKKSIRCREFVSERTKSWKISLLRHISIELMACIAMFNCKYRYSWTSRATS